MKKLLSGMLAAAMLVGLMPADIGLARIQAAEKEAAVSEERFVEIQVQNASGIVLATNEGKSEELVYEGTYNYENDNIVFRAPEGEKYLVVQVDEYAGIPSVQGEETAGAKTEAEARKGLSFTYGESLVYAPEGEIRYTVPKPSDYNDVNNFSPYDKRAFTGTTHKIRARVAKESEIYSYRNLAVNPIDNYDLGTNYSGKPVHDNQHYNKTYYPHAITNYVTRDELRFVPRNAIDGFSLNNWHSFFPYQSWAGGARSDLEFSVLFGRTVEVDRVDIYMRAQWSDHHDSSWCSATLEFSDGTEMPITLEKTAKVQSFTFEKKKVSWVRIKDLKQPVNPLGFAALTEFEVYGKDIKEENSLPAAEKLIQQAEKVNDYWINLNDGALGNHEWNNAVYYTGNMELYYLTGDENYYKYAKAWADSMKWIGFTDYNNTGMWAGNYADNHTAYQTFIDLYNIEPEDKKIKVAKQVMDRQVNDTSNEKDRWWWWIDAFYMAMPVYTKLGVVTGDTKYFDKMYALFNDAKSRTTSDGGLELNLGQVTRTGSLYDRTDHLWYRDAKYLPGQENGSSSNGKKVYWSRGNGWVMAAFAKVLQDLPDSDPHKKEYEENFKEMAAELLKRQGEDGFWRRNLDDSEELPQPETSGTAMFLYAFAWGVNNGLLDAETYMPAISKGYHGLNNMALHPNGRVGRVQPIGENPSPQQDIGYARTHDFGVGAVLLMLCEMSKLDRGVITDDIQPMLEKRMTGSVGIKVDSAYKVTGNTYGGDGCKVKKLVADQEKVPLVIDGKVYVPVDFAREQYKLSDWKAEEIQTQNGTNYVSVEDVAKKAGKELCIWEDVIVIGNQQKQFRTEKDAKLLKLLSDALSAGKFTDRKEYEDKFDYILITKPENLVPVKLTGASESPEFGNIASNTLDRSLSTRWSAEAKDRTKGHWIRYRFDKTKIHQVGVAFHQGKQRSTTYQIEVSTDYGKSWKVVSEKKESSGNSNKLEYSDFDAIEATDVRITGYGNSESDWVSISEVEILAAEGASLKEPDKKDVHYSTDNWNTVSLGTGHTGRQIVEFDVMPLSDKTDGVMVLTGSDETLTDWGEPPIAIRLNPSGLFDARNGGVYASSATLAYEAFRTYHVKICADIDTRTYSVEITDDEGESYLIASDYSFRTGAQSITDIGKLCARGGANTSAEQFIIMNYTAEEDKKDGIPDDKPNSEDKKPADNNDKKNDISPGTDNQKGDVDGKKNDVSANKVRKGDHIVVKNIRYKVTNASKGTVSVTGVKIKKKVKNLVIGKTVKIKGKTFRITEIGKKAFANCTKLKKVTIGSDVISIGSKAFYKDAGLKNIVVKTKKLKSVGSYAFKGIHKKAKMKVPSSKLKKYKKMFKKKGHFMMK